jgi:hypothetical protein
LGSQSFCIYGCSTISNARNAYANVCCYFRKRDLLATAERWPDRSLVGPVESTDPNCTPVEHRTNLAAPILIIPRGQPLPPSAQSNNVKITINRR